LRRFLKKYAQTVVLLVLIIFSLTAMSLQSGSVRSASADFGYSLLSTVQLGFAKVGGVVSDTLGSIRELRKVRREYEELQERINRYEHVERSIVDLRKENEHLRELLGFSRDLKYPHVAARIIGKDPGDLFKGIKINRGSRHGVREDDPVVSYTEGFQALVGKVVGVGPNTAIVQPIIDSGSYVAARMRDSRYEGLVRGTGKSSRQTEMRYVRKRAKAAIRYGNLVVTSGNNSIYPPGLYIGRVEAVEAPEWETTLTVTINPIADFARMEYVFVLVEEERGDDGEEGGA
jgi:rod shape-determining protein MreC